MSERDDPLAPGDRRHKPAGFNPYVQGGRGVFALAVFVFHVGNSGLATAPALSHGIPLAFTLSLQFGVELFFGISGYVIYGTLQRARSAGAFFRDRLIRILPVLWATMPFVIVLEHLDHRTATALTPEQFLPVLLANLFCLPGVLPIPLFHYAAWSLSYEMTFYVVAAMVWLLWRNGRRSAAKFMAIPIAGLLFLYPRGLFFLPGLLAARGVLARTTMERLTRYPLPLLLVFLAAWWGVRVLNGDSLETSMRDWGDLRLVLTGCALVAACLAFQGIVDGQGALGRLLGSRSLQLMGRISYSFYLWQLLSMAVVKRAMVLSGILPTLGPWSQAVFFLLALPPTLLLSWFSQRWIERDLSGWLRRRQQRLPLAPHSRSVG